MATVIETLLIKIGIDTKAMVDGIGRANSALGRFAVKCREIAQPLMKLGSQFSMYVTAPVVGLATVGVKSFMDFEAAVRAMNVQAKLSETALKAVTASVRDLSVQMGQSPTIMIGSLHQIYSAGFQGAAALDILKQSSISATAGMVSVGEATGTITRILQAYKMGAEKAGDVSDILFSTVTNGRTSFGELSGSIGKVVSTAASVKVGMDQVGAAIATMTKGGVDAGTATSALNSLMLKVVDNEGALHDAMYQAGIDNGALFLQTNGLAGVLRFLQQETGGAAEKLLQLGIDTRSYKAIAALTRDEGKAFATSLQEIGQTSNRTGSTLRAFQEQSKSLSFQWAQLKADFAAASIEIGASLAPIVKDIVEKIKEWVAWWRSLSDSTKENILRWAMYAAVIGPVLLAVGKGIMFFANLAKAIRLVGLALLWLNANPIVALISLLAAAAVGIVYLVTTCNDMKDGTDTLGEAQDTLNKQLEAGIALQNQMGTETANTAAITADAAKNADNIIGPEGRAHRLTPEEKEKGAKAEKGYMEKLNDAVMERMKFEEKINYLAEKRIKLAEELKKATPGSEEFFAIKEQQLALDQQVQSSIQNQVEVVKTEANKAKEQVMVMAPAIEKGSVEAYRMKAAMTKDSAVVEINRKMDEKLKELVKLAQDQIGALKEVSNAKQVELITIM